MGIFFSIIIYCYVYMFWNYWFFKEYNKKEKSLSVLIKYWKFFFTEKNSFSKNYEKKKKMKESGESELSRSKKLPNDLLSISVEFKKVNNVF